MENKKFEIITEEMYYTDENWKDKLNTRIKYIIFGNSCDYEETLNMSLFDCESPIEQLLAISLSRIDFGNINKYNKYIDCSYIGNQQKLIMDSGNTYRVDFYCVCGYKYLDCDEFYETKYFVIEADGYEFHQKTKEQVERDNKRQRELQQNGYEVIRFSGTEIYHHHTKCAEEVLNIIISNFKPKFKGEKE